jgi:hypothetical protein
VAVAETLRLCRRSLPMGHLPGCCTNVRSLAEIIRFLQTVTAPASSPTSANRRTHRATESIRARLQGRRRRLLDGPPMDWRAYPQRDGSGRHRSVGGGRHRLHAPQPHPRGYPVDPRCPCGRRGDRSASGPQAGRRPVASSQRARFFLQGDIPQVQSVGMVGNFLRWQRLVGLSVGARGGIRTRTPLRAMDFESTVSTIPPPGRRSRMVARPDPLAGPENVSPPRQPGPMGWGMSPAAAAEHRKLIAPS